MSNMKIEINLSDIFDEDGEGANVSLIIKEHIIYAAKNEVWNNIKSHIVESINKAIKEECDKLISGMVSGKIMQYMDTGMMTTNAGRNDEKEISIDEYLKHKFTTNFQQGNIDQYMKTFATKAVQEMKDRCDNAFAMHIVKSLSTQGLLKDNTMGSF